MEEINKKTYVKLLKARDKICMRCEIGRHLCEKCNTYKIIDAARAEYDKINLECNKPTTLYRLRFTMVTGPRFAIKSNHDRKTYVCIMQAENEQQAGENLGKWIAANPSDDEKIMSDYCTIKPLTENEQGIVYQNVLKEDDDTAYTEDSKTGKLYEIKLTTTAKNTVYGYTFIRRAENKQQAKEMLYECISDYLPHNQHISYAKTKIKRLVKDEYGVIFAEKPLRNLSERTQRGK